MHRKKTIERQGYLLHLNVTRSGPRGHIDLDWIASYVSYQHEALGASGGFYHDCG